MEQTQINVYNSQRLSDDQSRKLFIARQRQFASIMAVLDRTEGDDIPQHQLIVAQRGMGKTTLLKRIEVELKGVPWVNKFIPVLFPEAQYNVKDLSSFWLNCIDALADYMELIGNGEVVGEIDRVVNNLMAIGDEALRAKESYAFLKLLPKRIGRRMVLLIDNLNLIFSRLDDGEKHKMRSLMCENGAPIIIGASPVVIDELASYDAPFYDAFKIYTLEKLSFEELNAIITNLAYNCGNPDLLHQIADHKPRMQALYQLAGGNPRTAVILFRMLSRCFSADINDDLEALLDDLTPVYKGKLEELSDTLQVIVDAIALAWEPVTLEQIRSVTRYENGQLSPQIKRLMDTGWIEKPGTRQGKGGAYEITERIFNIWYLMRRSSRRMKKSVLCLSKFMEVYYATDIDSLAEKYLSMSFSNYKEVLAALAIARLLDDSEKGGLLCSKSRDFVFGHYNDHPEFLEMLSPSELYQNGNMHSYYDRLSEAVKAGKDQEAKYLIDSMLKDGRFDKKVILYNLAVLHRNNNDLNKAEESVRECLAISNDNEISLLLALILSEKGGENLQEVIKLADSVMSTGVVDGSWLLLRAHALMREGQYDLAVLDLQKLLEIDPGHVVAMGLLADAYNSLGRFNDGLELFAELYNRLPDDNDIWFNYAFTLIMVRNLVRAKEVIDKKKDGEQVVFLNAMWAKAYGDDMRAIELFEKCLGGTYHNASINPLGTLYVDTGNYDKLDKMCHEESKGNIDIIARAGNTYAYTLRDYERARSIYELGLATSEKMAFVYLLLHLYRDKIGNIQEAEKMYRLLETESGYDEILVLERFLFELRAENKSMARDCFKEYVQNYFVDEQTYDISGLIYVVAQSYHYGQTETMRQIMLDEGLDISCAPLYHALNMLSSGTPTQYLDTISNELRDLVGDIYEKMKKLL